MLQLLAKYCLTVLIPNATFMKITAIFALQTLYI